VLYERVNRGQQHSKAHRGRFKSSSYTDVELAIPKLRAGSYFPEWLLERRRRAEQAVISVVATSDLPGVSARRVEKLTETLGITILSKSQVSELAKSLDTVVEEFRSRELDGGPYRLVQADALAMKGPRGRPHGDRARSDRHRGERRWQAGDPRL